MRDVIYVLSCTFLLISSCTSKKSTEKEGQAQNSDTTEVDQFSRVGKWNDDSTVYQLTYKGPEFTKKGKYFSDAAHMTSTVFAHTIGDFLKSSYQRGKYRKLDLSKMKVAFKGNPEFRYKSQKAVEYSISVPILNVRTKEEAMTSIEHKGTWVRDYRKCSDTEFEAWKLRIEKSAKSIAESKLIDSEGFRELWLQWRDLESLKQAI
jgi:hypothetical protein